MDSESRRSLFPVNSEFLVSEEFDKRGFGARVRAARKRRGLTQTQLAESIGVALSAVTAWETGQRAPDSPVVVVRLARVLHATTDELLLGEMGWREWVRDRLMSVAEEVGTADIGPPRVPHEKGVTQHDTEDEDQKRKGG